MTFKEKLKIEHPEDISEEYDVGCFGCPYDHDYESVAESSVNCTANGGKGCEYCWNREMENTEVKTKVKKEFDWEEFKNKRNKIAVHCKTEEEAKDFCKQMHEHGLKWVSTNSYIERTNWHVLKEKTCYTNHGRYCDKDYYIENDCKILEWSDYMKKEFTKADLKDGMVVEDRNENMYLILGNKLINEIDYYLLDEYDEDLRDISSNNSICDYDIVKVFVLRIDSIYNIGDIFDCNNLELIWERKESKKMTAEEMRQKLEELTGEKIEIKYE